jgi:hypothetical protein
LKLSWQRIALFRAIRQLQEVHLWKELTFAYEKYNEFDNAVGLITSSRTSLLRISIWCIPRLS